VRDEQLTAIDLDYNNLVFDCNVLAGSAVLTEVSLCCLHRDVWRLCSHIGHLLFTADSWSYGNDNPTSDELQCCTAHSAFAIRNASVHVRTHCESLLQRLLLK
jgi:hypothetical protein